MAVTDDARAYQVGQLGRQRRKTRATNPPADVILSTKDHEHHHHSTDRGRSWARRLTKRREGLLAAIRVALGPSDIDLLRVDGIALAVLHTFLEALQPPMAAMVYGCRTRDLPPVPATGRRFRTLRSEFAR